MLKEVATGGNRIYPGLQERTSSHGKKKLKPLVDKFCRERGIALVAVYTIGRIIEYFIKYLKEKGGKFKLR
ncbi:MAG: hypothetical protein N2327_05480 [Caldimicrobium sp.]|nr:hypothetical protein [Caldimicrobium sp.]MCX7873862.1 hypothetical protein [Caldimicrobium sp.]MDW8094739.1 hypothetical protein [Caldimicrobium sp.]